MRSTRAFQFLKQPGASECPLAFDGALREAQRRRGILDVKAREEAEAHDLRRALVAPLQATDGRIEGQNLFLVGLLGKIDDAEGDLPTVAATFEPTFRPRVLNQNLLHGAGGGEEKMGPILPRRWGAGSWGGLGLLGLGGLGLGGPGFKPRVFAHPQIRLADERRGLQRVPGVLTAHSDDSNGLELLIDPGQQSIPGLRIAAGGGLNKARYTRPGIGGRGGRVRFRRIDERCYGQPLKNAVM